jgi:hypothetical protein
LELSAKAFSKNLSVTLLREGQLSEHGNGFPNVVSGTIANRTLEIAGTFPLIFTHSAHTHPLRLKFLFRQSILL